WVEGVRQHVAYPTAHPSFRGTLPFDATAIRACLDGADVVVLIGGPFFEEVWFGPGSPFPTEASVVQIEASPDRLSLNFPLRAGLLSRVRAALRALRVTLEPAASRFQEAADARMRANRSLKAQQQAAQRARAQKRWDAEPISIPRVMAELQSSLPRDAIV